MMYHHKYTIIEENTPYTSTGKLYSVVDKQDGMVVARFHRELHAQDMLACLEFGHQLRTGQIDLSKKTPHEFKDWFKK